MAFPDFSKLSSPLSLSTAQYLDEQDPLRHLRSQFAIPSRSDLHREYFSLDTPKDEQDSPKATYLAGNSLGLQPLLTQGLLLKHLRHWSTQGVYGHHRHVKDIPTAPWVDIDEQVAELVVPIVGANNVAEVAVMQSLTANLHLVMSSFYLPKGSRYKILIEEKAFPSDHFAVQSQARHHGYEPAEAMILLKPDDPARWLFSTSMICKAIEENKDELALVLLPGVHFYSGQLLDIETITACARKNGVLIGWDLAHAVGNVPLKLHDWGVDFAVWCSYKYLNSGPGGIGGLFVHERHHTSAIAPAFTGWWGSSKSTRFAMDNNFVAMPGAAAWQLSNPSMLDCTSLIASLTVFNMTNMAELRKKSIKLTGYLEFLLRNHSMHQNLSKRGSQMYTLLTPEDPNARGAQISVKLREGLLEPVMKALEEKGVVVDERRPDVIRVAPTPLYNTFEDAWRFVTVLWECLDNVQVKS